MNSYSYRAVAFAAALLSEQEQVQIKGALYETESEG